MAVYQSKSVTKDGKSFFYKVQYTTGDSEETRTKVSKKYATREETMQAEHDFLIWIVDYKDVPVDMTFQELYDKFIEDRKQVCKFTTLATYPNMYKYLKVFMKIKCVDYDIEHFNKWQKQMAANKKYVLDIKMIFLNIGSLFLILELVGMISISYLYIERWINLKILTD